MHIGTIDNHSKMALAHYHGLILNQLENHDVISYLGDINTQSPNYLKDVVEHQISNHLNSGKTPNKNLAFILTTPGGVVEAAEKMVQIIRHHYDNVKFIIPEMAMSAGTIICMSGDEIYMNYSSSLGPIDPQVLNKEGRFVPALGYLDKIEEIIQKSANGTCSQAEYMLLANQDLGTLRRYEQARDLSISLLQKWLVDYKFKNWSKHSTGKSVTKTQKVKRAQDIAKHFCNHKHWHSHSRYINMQTLVENPIRLKIEDMDNHPDLSQAVNAYHDLLLDYQGMTNRSCIFHCGNNLLSM